MLPSQWMNALLEPEMVRSKLSQGGIPLQKLRLKYRKSSDLVLALPQEGKVRNIAYGIKISKNKTLVPGPQGLA